jgi:hypothetical protein
MPRRGQHGLAAGDDGGLVGGQVGGTRLDEPDLGLGSRPPREHSGAPPCRGCRPDHRHTSSPTKTSSPTRTSSGSPGSPRAAISSARAARQTADAATKRRPARRTRSGRPGSGGEPRRAPARRPVRLSTGRWYAYREDRGIWSPPRSRFQTAACHPIGVAGSPPPTITSSVCCSRSMGPSCIVMRHLPGRRPVKVSPAEDQHAVGEFGSVLWVPEMVLTTVDLPLHRSS